MTALIAGESTTPPALLVPNSGVVALVAALLGTSATPSADMVVIPFGRTLHIPASPRMLVVPTSGRVHEVSAATRVLVVVGDE